LRIWAILEDPYPGYEVRQQRTGILFPNYVVSGYPVGPRSYARKLVTG